MKIAGMVAYVYFEFPRMPSSTFDGNLISTLGKIGAMAYVWGCLVGRMTVPNSEGA